MKKEIMNQKEINDVGFNNDREFAQKFADTVNNMNALCFKNTGVKDCTLKVTTPVFFVPLNYGTEEESKGIFTEALEPYSTICDPYMRDRINDPIYKGSEKGLYDTTMNYFRAKFKDILIANYYIIIRNGIYKSFEELGISLKGQRMENDIPFKFSRFCGIAFPYFEEIGKFDPKVDVARFIYNTKAELSAAITGLFYDSIAAQLGQMTYGEFKTASSRILERAGINVEKAPSAMTGTFSLIYQYLLEQATDDISKIMEIALTLALNTLIQALSVGQILYKRYYESKENTTIKSNACGIYDGVDLGIGAF